MNRRLSMAIGIVLAIVTAATAQSPLPAPLPATPPATSPSEPVGAGTANDAQDVWTSPWDSLPEVRGSDIQPVSVTTPLYEIVFSTEGGLAREWHLNGYHESFRDPRYLKLRAEQAVAFTEDIVRDRYLAYKACTILETRSVPGNSKVLDQFVDRFSYREFQAYAGGERGDAGKMVAGQTEAPVNMVYAPATWPYTGLGGQWGKRHDQTIAYTPSRTAVTVTDGPEELVFSAQGDGFRLEKVLVFHPDRYAIDFTARLINEGDTSIEWGDENYYTVYWLGGMGRPSTAADLRNGVHIGWHDEVESVVATTSGIPSTYEAALMESFAYPALPTIEPDESHVAAVRYQRRDKAVHWVAIDSKFFIATIKPTGNTDRASLGLDYAMGQGRYLVRPEVGVGMALPARLLPGVTRADSFLVYVGPKESDRLEAVDPQLEELASNVIFASVIKPISDLMLWLLKWLHGFFPNYGICIILLTIFIKTLMFPLYHKQQLSMKRMQALQPKIAELKEQHKNDPQRLQRETMEFYKRNKINPAAGCLTMLPMMPIFIALWGVFSNSIELRGEPFVGWITDLSKPDGAFFFPIMGWIIPINVLPLTYALAMYWSQSRQQQPDTPNANVMKMIPFIFVFFFWNFASGVILYFVVSILIDTVQRLVMDLFGIGDIKSTPAPEGGPASVPTEVKPSPSSKPPAAGKKRSKKRRGSAEE